MSYEILATSVDNLVLANAELTAAAQATVTASNTAKDSAAASAAAAAAQITLLAAPNGSDLVGYKQDVTNSFVRTVGAKLRDTISVKDFGATGDGTYHPVSEWHTVGSSNYRGYASLAAVQVDYPHVTNGSQSIDWVAIQKAVNTGKVAYAPSGSYLVTDPIIGVRGGGLVGDGVDRWDTVFVNNPTESFRKEASRGTHIYAYGTFAKTFYQFNMSECVTSGGVRTVGDKTFKLTNFRNGDAVGGNPSTPRMYSACIRMATEFRVENLRIIPWFNGIAGYLDTATLELASDCDIGIDTSTAWRYRVSNVQVVGYWRMAGALVSVSRQIINGAPIHGNNERGFWDRCIIQGLRGAVVRGYDRVKVISHTANTITVPYDANFHSNDGSTLSYNGAVSSGFTYTSTTYDAGAQTITFNGVSPAIVGTSVVYEIRPSPGPNGLSYTDFIDCFFAGWEHSSGKRSEELGYPIGGPIEISGLGIRQPLFTNCKFQTHESNVAHLHDCLNVRMPGAQFEGKAGVTYLLASPHDSNSNAFTPLQRGNTDDLWLGGGSIINDSINISGFTPRGCYYDRGVFQTQTISDTDYPLLVQNWRKGPTKFRNDMDVDFLIIPASDDVLQDPELKGESYRLSTTGTDVNLNIYGTKNFRVNNDSGGVSLKVFQSGRVEVTGVVVPSIDGGTSCGANTARFVDTYSRQYTIGTTGTVRILSGAGSPEGAVTAVVGSTYQRSDGGAGTCFYVKEVGSGNTGWVAK